jgi:hypothetical protein
MRSRLTAAILALSAVNSVSQVRNMSETVLQDVVVSLSGPQSLPLAVVTRGDPAYDARQNFFTVSLRNESDKPKTLPLPEIGRHSVTKYRNPETQAEVVDNRTPPPRLNGAVETLAPGESKHFQVVFEYPARIATRKANVEILQFCVAWNHDWLRKSAYVPGSYDWNESFEVCREIRIVSE